MAALAMGSSTRAANRKRARRTQRTRRLTVQGSGVWTYTHNGINFGYDTFPNDLSDQQWLNHDRISRAKLLDLGAGVAYSFHHSTTNVFFSVGHSVYGANGHLRSVVAPVGIVKSFATRLARGSR